MKTEIMMLTSACMLISIMVAIYTIYVHYELGKASEKIVKIDFLLWLKENKPEYKHDDYIKFSGIGETKWGSNLFFDKGRIIGKHFTISPIKEFFYHVYTEEGVKVVKEKDCYAKLKPFKIQGLLHSIVM